MGTWAFLCAYASFPASTAEETTERFLSRKSRPRETVEEMFSFAVSIVAVRVERYDISDLDEVATPAWPYWRVEALHILSREAFTGSLLLFHVGESLDPKMVAAVPGRVMARS